MSGKESLEITSVGGDQFARATKKEKGKFSVFSRVGRVGNHMGFLLVWVETKDVEKSARLLFEYVEKASPGLVRVAVPPQPISPQGMVFQFDGVGPDVITKFVDLAKQWAGENRFKSIISSGPYAVASTTHGTHIKVQRADFVLLYR